MGTIVVRLLKIKLQPPEGWFAPTLSVLLAKADRQSIALLFGKISPQNYDSDT